MKTILVPTDFSELADSALAVAVSLARPMQAHILLLHTMTYPMPLMATVDAATTITPAMLDLYRDMEADARLALQELTQNPAFADVPIDPVLITNGAGLVSSITERPADLIVLASTGSSGLAEWLVGSNAEVIVRHAHCPVLVIKQPIAHFQPTNVLCAIDVDEELLRPHAYPFGLGQQALAHFLYVMTPTDNRAPDGIREWAETFANKQNSGPYSLLIRNAKTVPDGILAAATETNADLIVLYTHGYDGLLHLLSGSVAEDVLNHADVPVLVLRA
jgi:nucleotide-binding universal stress UspA family protein